MWRVLSRQSKNVEAKQNVFMLFITEQSHVDACHIVRSVHLHLLLSYLHVKNLSLEYELITKISVQPYGVNG